MTRYLFLILYKNNVTRLLTTKKLTETSRHHISISKKSELNIVHFIKYFKTARELKLLLDKPFF